MSILVQQWQGDEAEAFELMLGRAALKLWPELPREIQGKLFEATAPDDAMTRYGLAVLLHEQHPRTAHRQAVSRGPRMASKSKAPAPTNVRDDAPLDDLAKALADYLNRTVVVANVDGTEVVVKPRTGRTLDN